MRKGGRRTPSTPKGRGQNAGNVPHVLVFPNAAFQKKCGPKTTLDPCNTETNGAKTIPHRLSAGDDGGIFKLTNSGGMSTESIAYGFNESDGSAPEGDIIWDAAGNLYGTTSAAGGFCNGDQSGCGNV